MGQSAPSFGAPIAPPRQAILANGALKKIGRRRILQLRITVQQREIEMKKLMMIAAVLGFTLAAPFQAFAGQEDCKDGETWNETTQKCEKQ